MGDAHRLLLGADDVLIVPLGQGGNGLLHAPALLHGDDLAVLIAHQHGLDVQHRAHKGGGVGEPPRPPQVQQVVHGEHLAHVLAVLAQVEGGLLGPHAHVPHPGGLHHHQALPQRGGLGVHGADLPVRERLTQLLRRHDGGLIGAADARGHAHVHDVLPLPQPGGKGVDKPLGVDLGGGDLQPVADGAVKPLAVEGVNVQAGVLLLVIKIGKRDDGDILPQQVFRGQVGRGVGDEAKRHDTLLLGSGDGREQSNVAYYIIPFSQSCQWQLKVCLDKSIPNITAQVK